MASWTRGMLHCIIQWKGITWSETVGREKKQLCSKMSHNLGTTNHAGVSYTTWKVLQRIMLGFQSIGARSPGKRWHGCRAGRTWPCTPSCTWGRRRVTGSRRRWAAASTGSRSPTRCIALSGGHRTHCGSLARLQGERLKVKGVVVVWYGFKVG